MQTSLRQKRLREQRAAFVVFLVLALAYLIAGLPIVARVLATNDAYASYAAPHGLPGFAALDRNHDGYVDSSEAAAWSAYASTFAWADRNGDGRLNVAEFRAALRRLEQSR
jgi:hypothetical protein